MQNEVANIKRKLIRRRSRREKHEGGNKVNHNSNTTLLPALGKVYSIKSHE
jgi:hypothetical protein